MPLDKNSTLAPDSAGSVDGMTRSMLAMALFEEAKGEYAALKEKGEWAKPESQKAFHKRWAEQCYEFAVNHGGLYIKCSQFVASLQSSSEAAGVPKEYVDALRPLTDAVPPRPWAEVAPVAEEELKKPLIELVDSVEQMPIAAASLAQVHKAQVRPKGSNAQITVAVKLQYPSLREQIAADFEVMNMMQTMVAPTGYDFSWLLLVRAPNSPSFPSLPHRTLARAFPACPSADVCRPFAAAAPPRRVRRRTCKNT